MRLGVVIELGTELKGNNINRQKLKLWWLVRSSTTESTSLLL